MIDLSSIFVEWGFVAIAVAVAVIVSVRQIKRDGLPEMGPASPRQKIVCAVLLLAVCASSIIYYAGWHMFGGYEKQVALFSQSVMVIYVLRLSTMLRTA